MCPKDSYPFPNIDKLVGSSANYKLLSFMDTYSNYNHIPMYKPRREKITFMTKGANYQYNVISFSLKYVEAMYQRMGKKSLRKR